MYLAAIAVLCTMMVILVWFYLRKQRQAVYLQSLLTSAKNECTSVGVSHQQLQHECQMLKNKLQFTLEDPVTQLSGWQLFQDRLDQQIRESERYQLTLGVMYIDIDHFSVINDALSTEAGNQILKEVAARLQTCMRQVDSLCRVTKDTFAVLLAQIARPETAAVVAQRMLQVLETPFSIQDRHLSITACIGIALYPNDGLTRDVLLQHAEHAMHVAKTKGKQAYQFYQEQIHAKSQRELLMYTCLSRDEVFKDFSLVYEPVMDAENRTVLCMDAQLRWEHPALGQVSMEEIFSYASKQGKLNAITEWMLQNACRQFLHWRSLGFQPRMLGIPILLGQLESSQFIYRFSQILQELSFDPSWLLLEIREHASLASFDIMEKAFNMLTYLGVNIAIDEFGGGSFSLRYFKNFKIQYLRLDNAFADDVALNDQTKALIKSIIVLAENLTIQLIVPGVISQEQMEVLQSLGVVYMQGKLLGDPLSEREVTTKF